MSKDIDYCCPNITCRAFGDTFPMECWEKGEVIGGWPEFDHVGLPVVEDQWDCGACPCQTVPVEEFKTALEDLLRSSQSHTKEP